MKVIDDLTAVSLTLWTCRAPIVCLTLIRSPPPSCLQHSSQSDSASYTVLGPRLHAVHETGHGSIPYPPSNLMMTRNWPAVLPAAVIHARFQLSLNFEQPAQEESHLLQMWLSQSPHGATQPQYVRVASATIHHNRSANDVGLCNHAWSSPSQLISSVNDLWIALTCRCPCTTEGRGASAVQCSWTRGQPRCSSRRWS